MKINTPFKFVLGVMALMGFAFLGIVAAKTLTTLETETLEQPTTELEPVGMAYRGKLNTYQIMVGRTEINITEFVNKEGEHCMLATRGGEIDLICENH